jgi:hypothetical protein
MYICHSCTQLVCFTTVAGLTCLLTTLLLLLLHSAAGSTGTTGWLRGACHDGCDTRRVRGCNTKDSGFLTSSFHASYLQAAACP